VTAHRPRFQTTREHQYELARRFLKAADSGDLAELEALLADDVVLTGDGGGKAPALARSLQGRSRVARVLGNWSKARVHIAGQVSFHLVEVNGAPGALMLDDRDRIAAVLALEIADGQIQRVMSVVNPDKLAHIGAVTNLGELLGRSASS
jgi:RNA polymerase sigma-70 factor (ECF subfamily)